MFKKFFIENICHAIYKQIHFNPSKWNEIYLLVDEYLHTDPLFSEIIRDLDIDKICHCFSHSMDKIINKILDDANLIY